MPLKKIAVCLCFIGLSACYSPAEVAELGSPLEVGDYVLQAGHPSLANWRVSDPVQHPEANQPTPARVELGRELFFEAALSLNAQRSCGSCHVPERAWSDGEPVALDLNNRAMRRATPSILNIGYQQHLTWDGRATSLEEHALTPMENVREMGGNLQKSIAFLSAQPTYVEQFAAAYPGEPIGSDTIAKALAVFQRTLVSTSSSFDRWIEGDEEAMPESAVRGFAIFLDPKRGNCAVCHAPPHFNDQGFHNIGLTASDDLGRYHIKPVRIAHRAFRTPGLRNIAQTAPYFHNGEAASLTAAIDHYADIENVDGLSPEMKSINLNSKERKDLLQFLLSLTASDAPLSQALFAVKSTNEGK